MLEIVNNDSIVYRKVALITKATTPTCPIYTLKKVYKWYLLAARTIRAMMAATTNASRVQQSGRLQPPFSPRLSAVTYSFSPLEQALTC